LTNLTAGLLARHTPKGPTGRSAALIDIAQDLLLNRLADLGLFEHLVFKGGTALRKLYAGSSGRFSTDPTSPSCVRKTTPPRSQSC
jgi:predicted nucleotidyltransferase component of viral defense system